MLSLSWSPCLSKKKIDVQLDMFSVLVLTQRHLILQAPVADQSSAQNTSAAACCGALNAPQTLRKELNTVCDWVPFTVEEAQQIQSPQVTEKERGG